MPLETLISSPVMVQTIDRVRDIYNCIHSQSRFWLRFVRLNFEACVLVSSAIVGVRGSFGPVADYYLLFTARTLVSIWFLRKT
jgi:hypothetical protein